MLSPPTDDTGILLLRDMLAIQPKDRPTVKGALRNQRLIGLKSDNEESGDDKDQGSEWSAEDWTGLASPVESQV